MIQAHKKEAEVLYKNLHTFYAIAIQLKMWYDKQYTEKQIQKALGDVENNPVGHPKFRKEIK